MSNQNLITWSPRSREGTHTVIYPFYNSIPFCKVFACTYRGDIQVPSILWLDLSTVAGETGEASRTALLVGLQLRLGVPIWTLPEEVVMDFGGASEVLPVVGINTFGSVMELGEGTEDGLVVVEVELYIWDVVVQKIP